MAAAAAAAAIGALPSAASPAMPPRWRCEAPSVAVIPFRAMPRRLISAVASAKVAGTDSKIVNGNGYNGIKGNGTEGDGGIRNPAEMKVLIDMHKKAFIDGDETVLQEMEASICAIETEKNNLAAKLNQMIAEVSSSKEKFLRVNADFDNFRKQSEEDRSRFSSNIQLELAQSLLPVVDAFEIAKQQSTPETEKERAICGSYQGIYKQFVETLRSLGVGVVETVGKRFDPLVHEAVSREESLQFKSGIVSHEVRRGFLLKGKVIRPAKVKVSTGLSGQQATQTPTEDAQEAEAIKDLPPTDPTATTT